MSFRRPHSKPDASTQTIVDELRAVGYVVIYVSRPTDLLVTHPSWPPNTFRLLECKSPKGKKGVLKLRKDQDDQYRFCMEHGVPYVVTGAGAIMWLQSNAP